MRDLWLRDGVAFRTVLGEEWGGGAGLSSKLGHVFVV